MIYIEFEEALKKWLKEKKIFAIIAEIDIIQALEMLENLDDNNDVKLWCWP